MTPDLSHAHRADRALAVIAREAANFISREASSDPLITVTRAESRAHGERVAVFVSVFPLEKARSALSFLERQRGAFSDHLKEHTRVRLPHIDFTLENNEIIGQQ